MTARPPEYRDPATPDDVVVTDVAPPPLDDPTLGIALDQAPGDRATTTAAHRLVTIGDSLTHGIVSGAVFRTDLTWPALVAGALGVAPFDVPTYGGPLDGLPLNLEALVRRLGERFGEDLGALDKVVSPVVLHQLLDANEDYWERGDGAVQPASDTRYDNLGIYGWDVRDALSFTGARAAQALSGRPDDRLLGARPDHDNDLAALSVLGAFGATATQVGAAHLRGRDGGIDTLIVALGANNALDAVVSKTVRWSGDDFADLDAKAAYTVWRPSHFAVEYAELVAAIEAIAARRVVLATVPHVTIAPFAKGVNPDHPGQKWRDGSRYFPYYTDPWIAEREFRPTKHRHLTHQQARAIDSAIDSFNVTITDAVRAARRRGLDWFVVDLCGLLDGLAYRRFVADPEAAARNQWQPVDLPPPIADLDSRFFLSDADGRIQGGLFSLDGIHPTTSAYGVLAQAVLDVLEVAGVPSTPIDFEALRADDSLNADPPALVAALFAFIAPFATRFVTRS